MTPTQSDEQAAARIQHECFDNQRLGYGPPLAPWLAAQIQQAIDAATAELRGEVERLKDRLCIDPGGTDSIDALESALAQVRDERDALGTELAQQQQCLLARQQDYQTLQDERNALADTVAGLRQEIDGHLDYKLKLSNELHQAKAQVNQRQQLLTEAEIAIIDLRKELDSIKAQLSICGKPSPPHAPGLEGNEMKKWLKRVYCWLTHQWWGSWHYWGKGYVGYHHFRCDRCKEHWVIYHGN